MKRACSAGEKKKKARAGAKAKRHHHRTAGHPTARHDAARSTNSLDREVDGVPEVVQRAERLPVEREVRQRLEAIGRLQRARPERGAAWPRCHERREQEHTSDDEEAPAAMGECVCWYAAAAPGGSDCRHGGLGWKSSSQPAGARRLGRVGAAAFGRPGKREKERLQAAVGKRQRAHCHARYGNIAMLQFRYTIGT